MSSYGLVAAIAPTAGFPVVVDQYDQVRPDLVFNSIRSEYLLVYEHRTSTTRSEIRAIRLTADGAATGSPAILVTTPKDHRRPRVALNRSNGEYLVVWYDQDANMGVFARRLSPLGDPIGDVIVIMPPAHGEQSASVAYSPSPPHYLVAWQDYRNTTADIFAQKLSTSGELVGTNIAVTLAPASQWTPAIVYNDLVGMYFVAWADRRSGNDNVNIYGQFITNDGTLWGSDLLICSAMGNQYTPSVAVNDQNGELLVAWQDQRLGTETYNIFGQRLSSSGALLGNNFQVSAVTSNHQASPRLAFGASSYLAVWEDMRSAGQETNDVYGRWYSSSGAASGPDFAISIDPGETGSPAAAYDYLRNRFLVVWSDGRDPNSQELYGLFLTSPLPVTPTPTWTPTNTLSPTPTRTSTPTATPTLSPYGQVQGTVYEDVNHDGLYESGIDHPLAGARIDLYSQSNQLLGTRVTAQSGLYTFEQLEPNRTYRLVETAPGGYAPATVHDLNLLVVAGYPTTVDFGHVRSGRALHMPMQLRNFGPTSPPPATPTHTPTPSPDPHEPNDDWTHAWGPLQSDIEYRSYFLTQGDNNDYFYFDMPNRRTIQVRLWNMSLGHNYHLYLYNANFEPVPKGYSGNPGNSDETIDTDDLPPGRYYVRVQRVEGYGPNPYSLKAIYR